MNWLPLRKNTIPLIDRQVDKVVTMHKQLRQSIMQGDILSVQKMSDLQLSIKKRIKDIDQFYNQHCLDQRIRFLQGARMKLSRLIINSTLQEKQLNINLPWKAVSQLSGSRHSNSSSKKNLTPQKLTPRKQNIKHQQSKGNLKRQANKSPTPTPKQKVLNKTISDEKTQKVDVNSRKSKLQVQIPDDNNNLSFVPLQRNSAKQIKKVEEPARQKNTGRKLQYIPAQKSKNINNISYGAKPNDEFKQKDGYRITINEPVTHRQTGQGRSQVTNTSGRPRNLTESNGNSMKKLNDLIFTIKMTKQEYDDFMQIKQKLNQGTK